MAIKGTDRTESDIKDVIRLTPLGTRESLGQGKIGRKNTIKIVALNSLLGIKVVSPVTE